jgi:hypothetical protein
MKSIGPDVWVLTETYRDLSPGPAYSLVACSADAPDRRFEQGECWTAIWSRLPAEIHELAGDRERCAAAVVVGLPIVGTVLPWLADSRDSFRGADAFCARLAEQAQEWSRLQAEFGCICVAGDFNQDLLESGHYYGSNRGRAALRDTLHEAGLECITAPPNDPLGAVGLACIDHICVGGVGAGGLGVWPPSGQLDRKVSDHHGFHVEVERIT